MSRDWNSILHNRIRKAISRWLDSSHENDPRLPAVILAEAIQREIDGVKAERLQWEDELNSSYNEPYHEEEEPPFP